MSDSRSVLHSDLDTTSQIGANARGKTESPTRTPGVVDIWENLLFLSRGKTRGVNANKAAILKRYTYSDIEVRDSESASFIGSGASFTVERRQISRQTQTNDEPSYVAIKKLNLFK
ncbi:hypothetical protein FOTG_17648 [Fusarium oxysporum f. sp. vasinfectum 25433]|uniref:Uncharacterized protein n=1 Tax=Fusarium oxysporum f. sp. vasinfectum 25433 TaxID=1089449 RepID=X0KYP5_FUSOX|nr:hypothetical protein FOTG_17648 [Fusarium oxysporum f. sp. vasinfectum 25433]